MQSIPGFHRTQRVEVFCYSLSADDSTSFRRKITEESEHFVDLSKVRLVGVGVGVVIYIALSLSALDS